MLKIQGKRFLIIISAYLADANMSEIIRKPLAPVSHNLQYGNLASWLHNKIPGPNSIAMPHPVQDSII